MYKTEKLYAIYEDDSGHRHLIPKEHYTAFEKALTRIDESYDEHGDEDIYYEELNDLLDYFSKHTLEGEPYYVVLPEDLTKCEEGRKEIPDPPPPPPTRQVKSSKLIPDKVKYPDQPRIRK